MNTSKIIRAVVGSGRCTETAAITKEDYGRVLKIEGIELPETYEIDFSNDRKQGTSVTMIGNADGVLIPQQFIKSGKDIYAFYYHVGENYGKTTYIFRIPNHIRPDRTNDEPEPEQQSVIDQTIAALNTAVAQTSADVETTARNVTETDQNATRSEQAKDRAEAARDSAANSADSAERSAMTASQTAKDAEDDRKEADRYAGEAAESAEKAKQSADAAAASQSASAENATKAETKAGEAEQSASTASEKEQAASIDAETARLMAEQAAASAGTASGHAINAKSSADAAALSKADAETAKTDAEAAKDGAVTAKGDAEQAKAEAQEIVDGINAKSEKIDQNATDITDLKENLKYYSDTNIFENATWQNGYYISVATLSNTNINEITTRICTQITLSEDLPTEIVIAIINNLNSYECGLFDASGNSLGYKSGWQSSDWNYIGSTPIKYIRLNIRNNDNSAIASYTGQIKGFRDGFATLLDAYRGIKSVNGNIDKIDKKADLLTAKANGVLLNADDWELGTISNGSLIDSTIRARTKNYIAINGIIDFVCNNPNIEFCFEQFNDNDVWLGSSSYYSGNGKNVLNSNATKFKMVVKHKVYPYEISTSEFSDFVIGFFPYIDTGNNIKLNVMSFNCGHYNYGSSSEYSGDDMQDKITEWKKMMAKYKPDIMFGQEMSHYFDAAQTVDAIETIFKPLLPYQYFYSYTRVASKIALKRTWQEDITVTVDGITSSRSLGTAIINIEGKDILFCSVHLPAGYSASDTAIREAMRDKLIASFDDYPYVVMGGDFNESTDSFFAAFVNAGYSLGNHGYFGMIETLPNESVDNIIIKGFSFYDAVSNSIDKCTSDHYPFVSSIHIK